MADGRARLAGSTRRSQRRHDRISAIPAFRGHASAQMCSERLHTTPKSPWPNETSNPRHWAASVGANTTEPGSTKAVKPGCRAVLASVTTSVTKRPAFPVVAGPTVRPKCLKFSGFDGCLDSVRRFAPDFGSLVPGSSPGRVTSSRKSHPRRSLRNPKRKRRNTLRRFHSLTLQVAELASKWRCPMADEE